MNDRCEILLIEDNASDADLTIRALRKSNVVNSLLHLQDGEEALEYIFATGRYAGRDFYDFPKVILLDLKMPKITGLEVLQKLKEDPRTKVIPVVLLTSSREDSDIAAGYSHGVNSYVVKPVSFEDFVKVISETGVYWLFTNQVPS